MTLFFVFLILAFIVVLHHPTIHPPPSHSAQPPSPAFIVYFSETPPPSSPHTPSSYQLNKIVDALDSRGDLAGWANILSSTDPSTLPVTATLFIPTDDANSTGMFLPDTFLIPYHIVPRRLTFSDLRKYPVSTKLPNLLPTKFIVVTNDSAENFTVDGTRISHPDLYLTGSFSVHVLMSVLDYEVYRNGTLAENKTETRNGTMLVDKKEPGNGGLVVYSFGGWLVCNFWINVAVVCVVTAYFNGLDLFDTEFSYWLVLAYIAYRMRLLDQGMSSE